MTEELYPLEEAAEKLGCTVDKIMRLGINGEIAIAIPLRGSDTRRYITPDDLEEIHYAYEGKNSVDIILAADSPEKARNHSSTKIEEGGFELHNSDLTLVIGNYPKTTANDLYITQDELDRYTETQINTVMNQKSSSIQVKREAILQSWLNKNEIKPEQPIQLTQEKVWYELAKIDSSIFYPVGKDARKDFFKIQTLCSFKRGRRN